MKSPIRNTHVPFAALFAASAFGISRVHFDTPPGDKEPTAQPPAQKETLAEEATRLQNEAQALFTKAKDEKRAFSDDEQKSQDARLIRLTAIKDLLDQQAKFAKIAFDAAAADDENDTGAGKVRLPTDPPGKEASDQFTAGGKKLNRDEFSAALTRWGNTGVMESKFATITTATNSSVLLPKQVAPPILPNSSNAFREAHDIYGLKPLETTTTANMTIPVLDATAGGKVSEAATADGENEPSVSESVTLNPSTYGSGAAWYSNQLLAANDFDLLSNTVPQLVYGKELGLESDIVSTLIADATVTNVITTDATDAISYDELVDLNNALPKRYDRLKAIVLGQSAYNAARKLKGADGHPVLVMDPQNGDVFRFNGTPVLRSDYFESLGASKTIGCVVSLLGFRLRDVSIQNLQRYVADRLKRNQTGLELFAYHAFGWAPSAVAKLKTPAS